MKSLYLLFTTWNKFDDSYFVYGRNTLDQKFLDWIMQRCQGAIIFDFFEFQPEDVFSQITSLGEREDLSDSKVFVIVNKHEKDFIISMLKQSALYTTMGKNVRIVDGHQRIFKMTCYEEQNMIRLDYLGQEDFIEN